ncbi:hypothetical protein TTHERM_00160940 (macronuclear) [Tetrahymena thermophila SB210]|uniref:Uncharacterized protein n=1 Tax=Tetrahymena thermophila (strain SB210) TaxID=312017 RepID=Q22W38_TETTS|nr:hypothetical protein TTHERM_00160940 [Tetrahymena thermophila SB210]EAR89579.1 hypothetical protein TTHERM_00160940 [Tetrahymena thermophila SB210]|eukprot:XP_001009824.1 hypothetical protein TTHERM_00160940 [Tetrahymena thermophila SB210]
MSKQQQNSYAKNIIPKINILNLKFDKKQNQQNQILIIIAQILKRAALIEQPNSEAPCILIQLQLFMNTKY